MTSSFIAFAEPLALTFLLLAFASTLTSAGGNYCICGLAGSKCPQRGCHDDRGCCDDQLCNTDEPQYNIYGNIQNYGTCSGREEIGSSYICEKCRTDCVIGEGCDIVSEREDDDEPWPHGEQQWCDANCEAHDCGCDCESGCYASGQVDGYKLYPMECVWGSDIIWYARGVQSKSVQECADLCDAESQCEGFEAGAWYGGSVGRYGKGDCILQSDDSMAWCDGGDENLNFYKRRGRRGPQTGPSKLAAMTKTQSSITAATPASDHTLKDLATYVLGAVGLGATMHFLWKKCRANQEYKTVNDYSEDS